MPYISGDHNVICDRCGRKKHRSQCRKTYDGLIVCADTCWFPKHPQESVKARVDKQSVSDPRPDPGDAFKTTTLSAGASEGDLTITVASVTNIADGDSIGIVLDTYVLNAGDQVHWSFVDGDPSDSTVTLKEDLPGDAASGNIVYISGDHFLSTNEITIDDL